MTIQENIQALTKKIESLTQEEKNNLYKWYDTPTSVSLLINKLKCDARYFAEETKRYADNKGYGRGECHYYFNELEDEAEDIEKPIIEEYSRLARAYFDYLYEVEETLQ